MTNAMHTSKTVEHYSPLDVIEAARATLKSIDLDPASCTTANARVKATRFFDATTDGLHLSWGPETDDGEPQRVFLNPPGGKDGNESVAGLWWAKLCDEWLSKRVDSAIFVAFKLDLIQVSQGRRSDGARVPCLVDFPVCYPSSRLRYTSPDQMGQLSVGTSPPHASCVVYLPSRRDPEGLDRFAKEFDKLGAVRYDHRFLPKIARCATAAKRLPKMHVVALDGVGAICSDTVKSANTVPVRDLGTCPKCENTLIKNLQLANQVWARENSKQIRLAEAVPQSAVA